MRTPLRLVPWLALVLAAACAAPRPTYPVPTIVGHRGASKVMPENTIAAFEYAWEQGADAVEADFRLTADGVAVAMHDATLERTTGDPRAVAEVSLADIRTLDASGEPVPTLAEMLAAIPPGKRLLVEIKTGPEILPPVFADVDASGLDAGQVVIIAFDEAVVAAARTRRPDIEVWWVSDFGRDDAGVLRPTLEDLVAKAAATGADGVDIRADPLVLDAAFVRALHDAGVGVHVWTINDPEQAVHMMELGVDTITTGRPGVIRRRLDRR